MQATKERQKPKQYYDKTAKPLRPLVKDETVTIRTGKCWSRKAKVCKEAAPRKYEVKTESDESYERSHIHLLSTKEDFVSSDLDVYIKDRKQSSRDSRQPSNEEPPKKSLTPAEPVSLNRSQRTIRKPVKTNRNSLKQKFEFKERKRI